MRKALFLKRRYNKVSKALQKDYNYVTFGTVGRASIYSNKE